MNRLAATDTDRERQLQAWLEARRDEQDAVFAALVRAPSDNPPGDCAAHAALTATLLGDLGFEVERHPVPASLCAAAGVKSVVNLVVRRRFGDGPVIALNAHGDVVPPGDGWSADPYGAEVREGWLYGRGAAVSKSDIATYAYALAALDALPSPLAGTVELHVTYDEETGGTLGPNWLLSESISKPDLAICAGFSYAVVTAHNGCLHLAVTLRGRSAHAAEPAEGADALHAASAVLDALYAYGARLGRAHSSTPGIDSPSMLVGTIAGGINTNVVPDRVRLTLDRRVIPEEDPQTVEAELRALVDDAVRGHAGISVGIERTLLAQALRPLPGAERLARCVQRHATEVFGTAVPCRGSPLYTDARHYAAAGVPTVLYGAGPRTLREANAHRADERVALNDLHRATEVVARSVAELLGPAAPCDAPSPATEFP